jgi:hypothetical protein
MTPSFSLVLRIFIPLLHLHYSMIMKMDVSICCAPIFLAVTYLTVSAASAGIAGKPHLDTCLRDGAVWGVAGEKTRKTV